MTRTTTLAMVLATAFAASCAKETPNSRTGSLESPTDRATAPSSDQATPEEADERFSHTSYPDTAVTDSGPLGKARGGSLIAASGETSVDFSKAWENGPAVIIFYRGHW